MSTVAETTTQSTGQSVEAIKMIELAQQCNTQAKPIVHSSSDYEYKGLMAQTWDLLRGDTSQWADRFFFLDVIKKYGQPVLDIGCGTGRLLIDFLQQGIDIDGMDNSPEMLTLCRKKGQQLGLTPTVYEQYMETLTLPRTYGTILVPSSSLQLIIEASSIDKAMQRLYAHLQPGGVLVTPLMTLWKEDDPLDSEWERSAVRPEDGVTIRRVARSHYNPASECESTEDIYQLIKEGVVVAEETHRRALATRSYTQQQAQALFARHGFAEIQIFSGFTFEPVKPADGLFTVMGRRPIFKQRSEKI